MAACRKSLQLFACVVAWASLPCLAQTTDAYHSIQIFPVVVDTAAFTQRFNFRNPNALAITITPRYFPANGTSGLPLTCPDLVVPAGGSLSVASLRALCPALAAGSQFGFLHTSESNARIAPFAAFSRVANPQGNGFAVEAFPASAFTSATAVVNGVRRVAASGGAPAFQTNCFVGNLDETVAVGVAPSTTIHYSIFSNAGALIAGADLSLAPGQFQRLLDVFAIAPAGDYPDAYVKFEELGAEEPGLMSFCTVQDNTSFGADFRIAKQELGDSGSLDVIGPVVGPQDESALRDFVRKADARRPFRLNAGQSIYNEHLFYFRHPDYVQCELLDVATGQPLTSEGRLEMRLSDAAGNVLAGGNNITGFGRIYLGEKTDFNQGSNGRYFLRVEDNEGINSGTGVTYRLHCQSGSGETLGDIVVSNAAGDAF